MQSHIFGVDILCITTALLKKAKSVFGIAIAVVVVV
jgi:hypothetical protein